MVNPKKSSTKSLKHHLNHQIAFHPFLLPSYGSTPTTPEVAVGVGLLGIEGGVHPLQRLTYRGSWDEIDDFFGFLWDDYGMMMRFFMG